MQGPERYTPHRRGGAKSFVDDLVLGRGVVLSRAATSLRSIETQPWTRRFVCFKTHVSISWFGLAAKSQFFFLFKFLDRFSKNFLSSNRKGTGYGWLGVKELDLRTLSFF